jgi:uncharacterized protein (TIGR02466 family)
MKVQPWFPTPIYVDHLEGRIQEQVNQELMTMFQAQREGMSRRTTQYEANTHQLTDPNFNCNVLAEYQCHHFLSALNQAVRSYVATVGATDQWIEDFSVVNSWCTLTQRGEYAVLHDHVNTDIAGVYYLQTTGDDGDFYFKTPNETLSHSYAFQHIPTAQAIRPQVGQLMLWPGFMWHGTHINQTPSERISISFNIQVKRWWQDSLFGKPA